MRARVMLALSLAALLGTTGCGISASSPADVGDGLVAGAPPRTVVVKPPPDPDSATSEEDLVASYLEAAVGGGPEGITQVKEFLTKRAVKAWVDPPKPQNPVVIRLLNPIKGSESTVDRKPVTVQYKVIGVLNDQGRVDDLSQPAVRTMTFWVAPAEPQSTKLRIDEIVGAPAPLMLSDEALTTMYGIQPVYFWDAANLRLVPDLRYVPLTQVPDRRASSVVQWLVDGPSPWLAGAQRLPTGSARRGNVVTVNGTLVVDLNAQAGVNGPDAIHRLYYQLRWSLRNSSGDAPVELRIDGKVPEQLGSDSGYLAFNETDALGSVSQRKFDIRDQHVTTYPPVDPPLAVLNTKDNANVVYAAVTRNAIFAAFVRLGPDNRRTLQIIRDGGRSAVTSDLKKATDTGRPAWLPGRPEVLVVPSGGRLFSVAAVDGHSVDITPSRMDAVRSVAVSPDGRRIAIVADGQPYVASLNVDDKGAVTVGSNPRPVLAGDLTAVAAAWDSESRLYVAGSKAGAGAMWQVTADGVVALDWSVGLKGVVPSDVVAFAKSPRSLIGEVYMISGQTVYPFSNNGPLTPERTLLAPFYAT